MGIEEAEDEGAAILAFSLIDEFVVVEAAAPGAVCDEVFEFEQAGEVAFDLRLAPAGRFAGVALGEADLIHFEVFVFAAGFDVVPEEIEEAAGLRRHFIKAAAEAFRGEAVGSGDVVEDGFNILAPVALFGFSLVLVEQRDGVDEGEVFFLIPAHAGVFAGEG